MKDEKIEESMICRKCGANASQFGSVYKCIMCGHLTPISGKGIDLKKGFDDVIIKELPRCKHGKALCDWGGNETAYDECKPTAEQIKIIGIIKSGNRRSNFESKKGIGKVEHDR